MQDTANPNLAPAFSTDSLAARWDVHRNTIRRMIRRGELRAFKVSRQHRIPAEEVQRIESRN